MEIWTLPDKYQNKNQNFHCDNPMHGYGCFHLDKTTKKSKLSKEEQITFDKFLNMYSLEIEDLEEGWLEDQIEAVGTDLSSAEDRVSELEEDVSYLEQMQRLWEKSELGT